MTKVDRQTTTPFLLKLFYRNNDFHRLDEFTPLQQPSEYLQIYTWPTCSLRELTHLLQDAIPSAFSTPATGTRVAFRLVFPDMHGVVHNANSLGRYSAKEMGSVVVGGQDEPSMIRNGAHVRDDPDGDKCLQDFKFVIGDWVSCAILLPLANGDVAPAPAPLAPARGGFAGVPGRGAFAAGPRENGFPGRGRRGGFAQPAGSALPAGEWRRGERVPDEGPGYRGGWSRGRGRW